MPLWVVIPPSMFYFGSNGLCEFGVPRRRKSTCYGVLLHAHVLQITTATMTVRRSRHRPVVSHTWSTRKCLAACVFAWWRLQRTSYTIKWLRCRSRLKLSSMLTRMMTISGSIDECVESGRTCWYTVAYDHACQGDSNCVFQVVTLSYEPP